MSQKTSEKKVCFVVMGFGEKVDFQTGRKLNLDASYHNMIKPAVEEAGLECIRADEIVHSGLIDVPMYEHLLKADVVIADLSTYNPNAFYELGVRHALRPRTTIVIAEDKLHSPFDVNYMLIRRYRHLGDDLGVGDVRKFTAELKQALQAALESQLHDSPVYTFLNGLRPPQVSEVVASVKQAPPAVATEAPDVTRRVLLAQADEAQQRGDFVTAKQLLTTLRQMQTGGDEPGREDPYVIQRLALVTYRSNLPTLQAALEEARDLLSSLGPATSNDTETLRLWGVVHRRLWDATGDAAHLDEAVRAYERGFYLRNDHENGSSLALLLNVRAAHALRAGRDPEVLAEAIADFVQAERVRREVLDICDDLLAKEDLTAENRYWVLAALAEAYVGVGDEARAEALLEKARAAEPQQSMVDATTEHLARLRQLLADSPLRYVRADDAA